MPHLYRIVPKSPMPVQVLILAVLADMSEHSSTIPQLVTWRGDAETETTIALLCTIWRKQETIKNVKRDINGCISESEAILEGKAQATLPPSWKYCPAVTEMKGCARPKIYAIFYNIMRRYYAASNAARTAHGIDFSNLTYRDEITALIINNYEFFKMGEVWKNLWFGLLQTKMTLLPHIESSLFLLSKTYLYTAGNTATKQQSVTAHEINKELHKERELYDNLRSIMRTEALNSFMVVRNHLFNNSREINRLEKMKTEADFEEQREKMDIDLLVPEYHQTRLVGFNITKAQPSEAFRIRKNSKLLAPQEYLCTSEDYHGRKAAPSRALIQEDIEG